MERGIDRGESVSKNIPDDLSTFSQLIDLHITDMLDDGKALRRPKTYSLDKLKAKIGHVRLEVLGRERIIQFARDRRAEGAGPPTLSADISKSRKCSCTRLPSMACRSVRTKSTSHVLP